MRARGEIGEHKKVGASRVWARVDPELQNPAFRGVGTGSPFAGLSQHPDFYTLLLRLRADFYCQVMGERIIFLRFY